MSNTGDDALLAVAAWGIKEYLAPAELYATARTLPISKGIDTIKPIYAVKQRFKGEDRLREYLCALGTPQIIFGGGSLFSNGPAMKRKLNVLRLTRRVDHAALGVSLGPFRSGADEQICARLLRHFQFLGLRDQASLEIARAIAPDCPSAKTFDLSVLLPLVDPAPVTLGAAEPRRGVGLAVCDYERYVGGDQQREADRRSLLAQTLKILSRESAEELVLFEFNGHEHYGDKNINERLIRELGENIPVRYVPYSPEPGRILAEVAKLRALIAMRLHAAVFGYIADTPTVVLSYHPKCLGWTDQIGLNKELILESHDFSPGHLAELVTALTEGRIRTQKLDLPSAQQRALKNWLLLRDILSP